MCAAALLAAAAAGSSGCAATQSAQRWIAQRNDTYSAWQSLAQQWTPPPQSNASSVLFPGRADSYTLASHDSQSGVSNLGVSGSGDHAHYISSGGAFDIYIYRAGPAEATDVFKQVIAAVNQQFENQANTPARTRSIVGPVSFRFVPSWALKNGHKTGPTYTANFLSYSYAPPEYHGALWWEYGWLFLAQSSGPGDADAFLRGYLQTVSNASAPSFSMPGFHMPGAGSRRGGFHLHL